MRRWWTIICSCDFLHLLTACCLSVALKWQHPARWGPLPCCLQAWANLLHWTLPPGLQVQRSPEGGGDQPSQAGAGAAGHRCQHAQLWGPAAAEQPGHRGEQHSDVLIFASGICTQFSGKVPQAAPHRLCLACLPAPWGKDLLWRVAQLPVWQRSL